MTFAIPLPMSRLTGQYQPFARLGPASMLLSLQRRASELFRNGPTDQAILAYQALLNHERKLPNAWFNLAILQRRARRYPDALASYQTALECGIDAPEEVHLQRGVIYADDLDLSDMAHAELDAALAINPDYVPALLNLANLHEDRGDWPAAREVISQVLRLDPDNVLAIARMIALEDQPAEQSPVRARARALMARDAATALDRADLGFALGAALDREGNYDDAFAHYVKANDALRMIFERSGTAYDRSAFSRLVDRLIEAFPADAERAPTNREAPVFVCGMYRSGSTLVEQILGRHTSMVAGGELDILPHLAGMLAPYPEAVARASDEKLDRIRRSYLEAVAIRRDAGTYLLDKQPENFIHLGLVARLFPGAHIVHTVRSPMDNALSLFFLQGGSAANYSTSFDDISHYFQEYVRLMRHWRTIASLTIHDVDYDKLVIDPKQQLVPILTALDLDWDDAMLLDGGGAKAVRTASHWQVRQPLYRHASGRWRNYEAHLHGLRANLAPLLGKD